MLVFEFSSIGSFQNSKEMVSQTSPNYLFIVICLFIVYLFFRCLSRKRSDQSDAPRRRSDPDHPHPRTHLTNRTSAVNDPCPKNTKRRPRRAIVDDRWVDEHKRALFEANQGKINEMKMSSGLFAWNCSLINWLHYHNTTI